LVCSEHKLTWVSRPHTLISLDISLVPPLTKITLMTRRGKETSFFQMLLHETGKTLFCDPHTATLPGWQDLLIEDTTRVGGGTCCYAACLCMITCSGLYEGEHGRRTLGSWVSFRDCLYWVLEFAVLDSAHRSVLGGCSTRHRQSPGAWQAIPGWARVHLGAGRGTGIGST